MALMRADTDLCLGKWTPRHHPRAPAAQVRRLLPTEEPAAEAAAAFSVSSVAIIST